jgi:hypothetical protein
MDKKIQVRFWHSPLKDVPYEHGAEFNYSSRKRNQIIDTILALGYSVMIRPMSKDKGYEVDGILIWIDKGRFGQC